MKVKAFVHDPKEIARLAENLGIPDWRAPPPFQKTGVSLDTSPEFMQ
jgi:hypothetical protein